MRLAFALLTDEARATAEGKLEIGGGDWDTIYAPSFPARHYTSLTLVVRLLLDPLEASHSETNHAVKVEVIRPDGKLLFQPFDAEFHPTVRLPLSDRPAKHTLVFNFPALTFPMQGTYTFHISVDGEELGSAPLYAVVQEPSQTA
jgi:hypothetical protein